jgi:hypothetical protein
MVIADVNARPLLGVSWWDNRGTGVSTAPAQWQQWYSPTGLLDTTAPLTPGLKATILGAVSNATIRTRQPAVWLLPPG